MSIMHGSSGRGEGPPWWVVVLAYLAYLRSMRPVRSARSSEAWVLIWLIVISGLVLAVLALVVGGAPGEVVDLVRSWPFP